MSRSNLPSGVDGSHSSWLIPVTLDLCGALLATPHGRLMMIETHGDIGACLQCLIERALARFVAMEDEPCR